MTNFPCMNRSRSSTGETRYSLGEPLVDSYLEFVAGRARANTLRAVAFDLKTFFTVVEKQPTEVVAADVFEFLADQRPSGLMTTCYYYRFRYSCAVAVIRGSSDRSVLVLTSLSSGPKHGYALIKDIEAFAGVTMGPGSLYGAIAKLEHAGLVEALPGEGRRKPYRITARGAADLREQLERSQIVSKVGLGRLAGAAG